MALHILTGSGAPATTPAGVGHHYVDTVAKKSYISVGVASAADWSLNIDEVVVDTAISNHEAAADPHPGYALESDVATALSGKADASHGHALSDLSQSGATTGQVPKWNGSAWVPAADDTGGGGLTFPILADDGAVGAPSYSFASDPNTGVFLLAPDVLAWAIGGVTKFVLSTTDMNVSAGMTNNYLSGTAIIKFWNTAGDFGVTLRGNAAQTANSLFQFPIDNGTNGYVLQTNGSGITSWVAAGGGITWSTPVDDSIVPDTQLAYDIGASNFEIANIFVDKIYGVENCGSRSINVSNGELFDANGVIGIGWTARNLVNSAATEVLNWDFTDSIEVKIGLSLENNKILTGKHTSSADVNLIHINASNQVHIGPNGSAIKIYSGLIDFDGLPTLGFVTENGATAGRPVGPNSGYNYFDTDLGIPIWYDGTNWIDATGTTV